MLHYPLSVFHYPFSIIHYHYPFFCYMKKFIYTFIFFFFFVYIQAFALDASITHACYKGIKENYIEFNIYVVGKSVEWIQIDSTDAQASIEIGIFFKQTKFYAAVGIIILLILFLPAHIWFIQKGGCMGESLCVPVWVAWVRLIVFHPLLIAWAWWHRK